MLYENNKEEELTPEFFSHPDSHYRGAPFWSWNCKVTKELIHAQTEVFHKMGFGGAHLHPRTGLGVAYMGKEFLDLITYADTCAKENDMLCWLYDEDRYPSGAAGGIVTENWEYRARHLLLTRQQKEGMCASKEEFREAVGRGEKPAGYYLCAYRIQTSGGYMVSYERLAGPQPDTDSAALTREKGKLWFAYVELMHESPWFNDQTYIDVMNRQAVERFIEVTHKRYYETLGGEFGRSVPAIFTDEPQIKGSMALADGESEEDVTLSFTDDFAQTYEEAYGTNLLDILPELLWDSSDGVPSVHRLHYHDHLAERFVSAYSDTIAAWCEAHGLAMTGHYMSEPTLYSQTLRLGEAMRCYRAQQLPGVDILCGDPEYSTVKQAVSVARQMGREGVLSEMYGVTHWDFDFKGHKLQGDWQAALGVTIRVPHLAFMSMEGEAKRDWPASINYQSPWWIHYAYIENYFARVASALTRGRAVVDVAVIHPIESYWISYGPVAETGQLREQMDQDFSDLIDWLLFGLIDFDFLSESLLQGQCDPVRIADGRLCVGEMRYRTILVPNLLTMRAATLDVLTACARAGVRVIFLGEPPRLIDGHADERAWLFAKSVRTIPYQHHALMEALRDDRRIKILDAQGRASTNLFYQLRRDGKYRWLFVCHVMRKTGRTDAPEHVRVHIKGSCEIDDYRALTGDIKPCPCVHADGWSSVDLTLYAEDSFLWRLRETDETAATGEGGAGSSEEAGTYNHSDRSEEAGAYSHFDQSEETGTYGHSNQTGSVENSSGRSEQAEQTQLISGTKEGIYAVPTGTLHPYGLVAGSFGHAHHKPEVLQLIRQPERFTLEEPNVLLLDTAAWKLDDTDWQEPEEILRLDNRIRSMLGYPHRQDAYTQPWRIPYAQEDHRVTLCYKISSEVDTDPLILAMERPDKAHIRLNGQPCVPIDEKGAYYVDSFIRTVRLPGLKKGANELYIGIPFGRKTNLENIYLCGDIGVEVHGSAAVVTKAPERLYFGDITRQKLPFYGSSIRYEMKFSLSEKRRIAIRVPHFRAPVLSVSVDGKEKGLIAFDPHELPLGELASGTHLLEITACGNRFNTFGTLHNCNPEYKWYGPDSYRTTGSEWSEAYCLRPFGILSRVEILSCESR